eukprot:CAMPEP_0114594416 /NCGR_PEP_ID=MMETSP0125-20121206/16072_1 /TAXON_ID=485358 ORGANISM="Aristerostoma sp., Strain ATCC 50986" /NCGR_SAMPLE_ID=MMETSP0125 /ASSEMBLY_ACC=CAM_ASM_000245 /LENGTH=58 /DNA_ID=CAMNT_0001794697 /DNA_START=24 /DNA_END=200 /DNA_ORIENTATION=+
MTKMITEEAKMNDMGNEKIIWKNHEGSLDALDREGRKPSRTNLERKVSGSKKVVDGEV